MGMLRFVLGGFLALGGAAIVALVILALPSIGVMATFAGLEFSLVPFIIIGIIGLAMFLIGSYLMK